MVFVGINRLVLTRKCKFKSAFLTDKILFRLALYCMSNRVIIVELYRKAHSAIRKFGSDGTSALQ